MRNGGIIGSKQCLVQIDFRKLSQVVNAWKIPGRFNIISQKNNFFQKGHISPSCSMVINSALNLFVAYTVLCLSQNTSGRTMEESTAGKKVWIGLKPCILHNMLHISQGKFLGTVVDPSGHIGFSAVSPVFFSQMAGCFCNAPGMAKPFGRQNFF